MFCLSCVCRVCAVHVVCVSTRMCGVMYRMYCRLPCFHGPHACVRACVRTCACLCVSKPCRPPRPCAVLGKAPARLAARRTAASDLPSLSFWSRCCVDANKGQFVCLKGPWRRCPIVMLLPWMCSLRIVPAVPIRGLCPHKILCVPPPPMLCCTRRTRRAICVCFLCLCVPYANPISADQYIYARYC